MTAIAVLGASGRLGRLLRAVWPADSPAIWISRNAGDGLVQCDMLNEPDALVALLRDVRCVICLAGITHSSDEQMSQNTVLAEAAITASHKAGVEQVLLTSSAAVYGAQSGLLSEDDPCEPLSDYGRAKLEMERSGSALGRQFGIAVCSLRISNIAGADAILGGWREGFELDRFDDGRTPRRSYIGAATLAQVLARLSKVEGLPHLMNVAAPGVVEMSDLLDAAGMPWHPRPAPASAIPTLALSTKRLETHFDFEVGVGSPQALVAQWRQAIGT